MCYAEVIGYCLHALENFFIFTSSKKKLLEYAVF